MIKSGLIIGAVSLVVVLVSTLITPICAPCLGIFLGLVAGYVAGVFDKPTNSNESIKKGGIAGVIAGAMGLVGGLIGGVLNASLVNPADLQSLYRMLGISNYAIGQSEIWTYQLGLAACVGLFNIVWMGVLGIAGGALWYQITGKNQARAMVPPQEPIPPVTG